MNNQSIINCSNIAGSSGILGILSPIDMYNYGINNINFLGNTFAGFITYLQPFKPNIFGYNQTTGTNILDTLGYAYTVDSINSGEISNDAITTIATISNIPAGVYSVSITYTIVPATDITGLIEVFTRIFSSTSTVNIALQGFPVPSSVPPVVSLYQGVRCPLGASGIWINTTLSNITAEISVFMDNVSTGNFNFIGTAGRNKLTVVRIA